MKFRKNAAGVLSLTLLLTACAPAGEGDSFARLTENGLYSPKVWDMI